MKKIPLTQGQFALVDDADFEWLNQWKWQAYWNPNTNGFYAARSVRITPGKPRKFTRMHALITGFSRPDHIDGNGLNNQRHNLRAATRSQNGANRRINKNNKSGFKGVSWHAQMRKWVANITVEKTRKYLGTFSSLKAAAEAYDVAAREHFGEFARPNFV